MKNPCNECNNFHCYKSSKFNKCFWLCSITGIIDNTKKCKYVTPRSSDYKEFIEKDNEMSNNEKCGKMIAETLWKFDAEINLLNPDYKRKRGEEE